jgi:hypothetical protein
MVFTPSKDWSSKMVFDRKHTSLTPNYRFIALNVNHESRVELDIELLGNGITYRRSLHA